MTKSIVFLNKIHVDIKDSLFNIFRNKRYFLLIKNDVLSIFFVYIMHIKNNIFILLKNFRIYIEKQSNHVIKRIRFDNELKSHAFKN